MDPHKGKDIAKAVTGVGKTLLSRIPGLGEAISGWDAYKHSQFTRNVNNVIAFLKEKVDDFDLLFSDKWFESEEGQKFTRKVFDSAFDAQLEDKQELFVNALINGITDKTISDIEKLKFVDILRHLSLASLMILADMHKIVQKPRSVHLGIAGSGLINKDNLVTTLSDKYPPYLIESCFYEMEGSGLFSPSLGYGKREDGKYVVHTSHSEGSNVYTDFTKRFVEFITVKEIGRLQE